MISSTPGDVMRLCFAILDGICFCSLCAIGVGKKREDVGSADGGGARCGGAMLRGGGKVLLFGNSGRSSCHRVVAMAIGFGGIVAERHQCSSAIIIGVRAYSTVLRR